MCEAPWLSFQESLLCPVTWLESLEPAPQSPCTCPRLSRLLHCPPPGCVGFRCHHICDSACAARGLSEPWDQIRSPVHPASPGTLGPGKDLLGMGRNRDEGSMPVRAKPQPPVLSRSLRVTAQGAGSWESHPLRPGSPWLRPAPAWGGDFQALWPMAGTAGGPGIRQRTVGAGSQSLGVPRG